MVAMEDLKKDKFMQGLHKSLTKDLKVAGVTLPSIKQVDKEKNEEKQMNKGSVDQGNFLANHGKQCSNNNKRKGTSMVQYQNKSKRLKNHQKEFLQKLKCNQ